MDLNKKLCYCFNITVGDIKEEIETGSKAGLACKGCVKRVQETINLLLEEK